MRRAQLERGLAENGVQHLPIGHVYPLLPGKLQQSTLQRARLVRRISAPLMTVIHKTGQQRTAHVSRGGNQFGRIKGSLLASKPLHLRAGNPFLGPNYLELV